MTIVSCLFWRGRERLWQQLQCQGERPTQAAQPPADLATFLKSTGTDGVPIDPYSGDPFCFVVIDRKPTIYSVGPDGKDDKAQIRSNPNTREPGDLVFRLEPSSQSPVP